MPIYEYCCNDCGYEFEVMQKFSDSPIQTCSKCNGEVTKLISHSTFHLKGTGWYATDYAKKSTGGNSKDRGEKIDSKAKEDKKEDKKD